MGFIEIKNARKHNLRGVDVRLPQGEISVITGVSGSGKSSLAFETIFREGSRRYLSSISAHARHYLGKFGRGEADSITGLSPAVSVDQKTISHTPRSTVGTMTELNDYLRLLYSRLGNGEKPGSSSFFSFNSEVGACPACRGLGVLDRIDPELFVVDREQSLRRGALSLTTPSGYIVYSQVTMEVLDSVCACHGFSVDKPFKDLTPEERDVVLYGSDRIKVPFGKHPLESRLKWKGITAKPREEGFYKGIVPIMEDILRRDRNKNILRFVRSRTCETCGGSRLKQAALDVTFGGKNIAWVTALSIGQLREFFAGVPLSPVDERIAGPILENIDEKVRVLEKLELGYLTLDRESSTLSGGEAKRIRLAGQVLGGLGGVVYVLDEPTVGLHPRDTERLLDVLEELRNLNNTVVVVEHDETVMNRADWLVDVGPLAGPQGGQILFQGPPLKFREQPAIPGSVTWNFLTGRERMPASRLRKSGLGDLVIRGARQFNLRNIDVTFKKGALNVVTGVSGSGKSTLVIQTLGRALEAKLHGRQKAPGEHDALLGMEGITKVVRVDQRPIGRTPRSNPATYTDLFDGIRELFAAVPEAVERGWKKGRFSFNVKGGRCEVCEGAAVQRIGMHFMEDVEIPCEVCGGVRYHPATLEITYHGKNIAEVLSMSVDEALEFFSHVPKLERGLRSLQDVGLGYLLLGQSSTTLSGGESERVKLAAELQQATSGHTLYLLDEPTTGLHSADVKRFQTVIGRIVDNGNTVVVIEHNLDLVRAADWVVDLGPGGGERGGRIMAEGTPLEVRECVDSPIGQELGKWERYRGTKDLYSAERSNPVRKSRRREITFRGVSTNNLKAIELKVPHGKTTVITGVSGSGKSSLAIDTLYAEARRRFSESLSTQARRYFKQLPKPPALEVGALTPAISIGEERPRDNPRSTVATLTEIYDALRLLYSRTGVSDTCGAFTSQMFSFNNHLGACESCDGLGFVTRAQPRRLVTEPEKSLVDGAMDGHKTGRFYGERGGQHLAILAAVGRDLEIDFTKPWAALLPREQEIAMMGTGERTYRVCWKYRRKGRAGEHNFETTWSGFAGYVDEEYGRVHKDKRGVRMRAVMGDQLCASCGGERLREPMRNVRFAGLRLGELVALSAEEALKLFQQIEGNRGKPELEKWQREVSRGPRYQIVQRLNMMVAAGLGYLELHRGISTLSHGERRRLALVSNLGVDLSNITYILDEPTVGLHGRDSEKIRHLVQKIQEKGNTLIIVENDESFLRSADNIVEMGPGSGSGGGEIVRSGTPAEFERQGTTLTAKILAGATARKYPARNRTLTPGFRVLGANQHNLKDIDVAFPQGGIVAVTGVSGSGKSTLVFDVLIPSLLSRNPVGCRDLVGGESVERLVSMDQTPIGRSPASNSATYTGIFDLIRRLFATTKLARQHGMSAAQFSFNSKQGRCDNCKGMGQLQVEMGFLADVWVPCETCLGARYKKDVLAIRYLGKSIADVLAMTAAEALELFCDNAGLSRSLNVLVRVGLGYLPLGQSALTLSAGEAERLKLAKVLIEDGGRKRSKGPVLYIFDEPTACLHPEDVNCLIDVLLAIADKGHSVIVLEHNLDVIAAADWVIDLGPEGGKRGGWIVAEGTPARVAGVSESHTGALLRRTGRT